MVTANDVEANKLIGKAAEKLKEMDIAKPCQDRVAQLQASDKPGLLVLQVRLDTEAGIRQQQCRREPPEKALWRKEEERCQPGASQAVRRLDRPEGLAGA
jgi:hypothetical protein